MASISLPLVLVGAVASAVAVAAVHHLPCLHSACCSALERSRAAVQETALVAEVVEARSASVFAGACHYNGELVTQGGEALLAIKVERGASHGVDLGGVCAAALVSSDKNLKLEGSRRSMVYVSEGASEAQRAEIVQVLEQRSRGGLGEIVAVETAPVRVQSDASAFAVSVGEKIALSGAPMPDRACCKMPNQVWYEPLVPLEGRLVGLTESWRVNEPALALEFQRCEENSAFVGRLARPRSCCSKPCEPARSIE